MTEIPIRCIMSRYTQFIYDIFDTYIQRGSYEQQVEHIC
jgi:hypothetical protein